MTTTQRSYVCRSSVWRKLRRVLSLPGADSTLRYTSLWCDIKQVRQLSPCSPTDIFCRQICFLEIVAARNYSLDSTFDWTWGIINHDVLEKVSHWVQCAKVLWLPVTFAYFSLGFSHIISSGVMCKDAQRPSPVFKVQSIQYNVCLALKMQQKSHQMKEIPLFHICRCQDLMFCYYVWHSVFNWVSGMLIKQAVNIYGKWYSQLKKK